jgi:hypothetical protein
MENAKLLDKTRQDVLRGCNLFTRYISEGTFFSGLCVPSRIQTLCEAHCNLLQARGTQAW